MKPFTKIAALFFGVGALLHIYRLITQFQVIIGSHAIPVMASIVIVILGLIMCIGLWKESKNA